MMELRRLLIAVMVICACGLSASAQLTKKQQKQIAKEAKKEAKRLTKEGWLIVAGGYSIEKQLYQAYLLQEERDADNQPRYLFGQSISGGSFYDAAKLQAVELAKVEIAGNIASDLTTLVNTKLGNQQITSEKASSASEIIEKGKSLVSQKLGSTIPLIELYRNTKDGLVEVQIRLAYPKEKGIKSAMDAIGEELEKEGISLK